MTPYDDFFTPPAPVVQATIQNTNDPLHSVSANMQIDTGADMTLIPESAVSALGLATYDNTQVSDYRGTLESASVYYVNLKLDQWIIRNVRVIAVEGKYGILGRNILRAFTLTLNGKDQTFDLVDP
jgi:predicted aspartyl protease